MQAAHKRWLYFAFILVNIPAGLATRWYADSFPKLVAEYGGDVLSATCIFFGIRFLLVEKPLWKVAAWTYFICVLIELQQLYQAPWAVAFRNIQIIGILLGHGFLWSDLVCYAAGVLIGWAIAIIAESIFRSKKNTKSA